MKNESYSMFYSAIKYTLQQRIDEKSKQVIAEMEKMTNDEFNDVYWNMLADKFLERF